MDSQESSSMGNLKSKILDDDMDTTNQTEIGEYDSSMDSSVQEWTRTKIPSPQMSTPFQKTVEFSSSDSESESDKAMLTQKHKVVESSSSMQPPLKKTKTDMSVVKNGICNGDANSTVFLGKFNFKAMDEKKRQFYENAAAAGKTICLSLPKGQDQKLKGYGFLEIISNDAYELREKLEELLECPNPKCYERLDPPVYCCINGHAVCHKCELRGISTCPVCKSSFLSGRNFLINDILTTFQFRCKFSEHGCSVRSTPHSLKSHELTCDFRTVKCVLSKNGEACNAVIALPHYPDHVETEHDTYVHTPFTLNSDYECVLPKKNKLDTGNRFFRFLKDVINNLNFLEMTFYDETYKIYTISVHLIGKQSEASNFVYTIDVHEESLMGQFKYSNDCLPNIMSPNEAEKFFPFVLRDKDDTFSVHKELKYNLKIERKEDFGKSANQVQDGGVDNSLAEIPVVDI